MRAARVSLTSDGRHRELLLRVPARGGAGDSRSKGMAERIHALARARGGRTKVRTVPATTPIPKGRGPRGRPQDPTAHPGAKQGKGHSEPSLGMGEGTICSLSQRVPKALAAGAEVGAPLTCGASGREPRPISFLLSGHCSWVEHIPLPREYNYHSE